MTAITILLKLSEVTPSMIVLAHLTLFVIVGIAAGHVKNYLQWKGNALP